MSLTRRALLRSGILGGLAAMLAPRTIHAATGEEDEMLLTGDIDMPDGFTVPAGKVWRLDPRNDTTITVGGNIIVNGILRALPKPGVTHTIRFVGINEANIVGGHTMTPVATDIGLWVDGGRLDMSGTPKTTWNRTGSDPSWSPGDNLQMLPVADGEYQSADYAAGDPLPVATSQVIYRKGSRSYTAEVVNLTRNLVIESVDGRAHIMFVNVTEAQRLEFAELRRLGPAGKMGRYPLHVHMNGEGSDGSEFRGNVALNSGNHAFVTHSSNGCNHSGSIAWNTNDDAFWWDQTDNTDRVRWDRCVAVGTRNGPGFRLGSGRGNSCVQAVAFGTDANSSNAGFLWPSDANQDLNLWNVDGCVSHNNRTHGFRIWQNDQTDHTVIRCVGYRNEQAGFSHGAYRNRYRLAQCVAFDNHPDLVVTALGRIIYHNCWFERVVLSDHSTINNNTGEEVLFEADRNWPVFRVTVDEAGDKGGRGNIRFLSLYHGNDLTPADFTIVSQLSTITVENVNAPDFVLEPPGA